MTKTTCPSIAKFADFVQLKDYRPPTKDEYVRYEEVRIAPPQTLPLVLAREQVAALLGAVQQARYRTALTLIYGTGLRVGEAVRIELRDLRDTHTEHPRLHVRCGKGGKDRYVPLAPALVVQLRAWWKTHQHPVFLFPGPSSGWRERAQPADAAQRTERHLSVSAVQNTFRLARAASGVPAAATVHTLRHCYATHLLEEGVSLRLISQYLGHASLETTLIYTHLTPLNEARTRAALEVLHRAVRGTVE
ncbi:MAG: tyrosine-type recombinase/integrase [Verrucomicrobia bacterium]|nr:tyrosine-type recombinase/integrase [Verrucomicrobiota bacterium]